MAENRGGLRQRFGSVDNRYPVCHPSHSHVISESPGEEGSVSSCSNFGYRTTIGYELHSELGFRICSRYRPGRRDDVSPTGTEMTPRLCSLVSPRVKMDSPEGAEI